VAARAVREGLRRALRTDRARQDDESSVARKHHELYRFFVFTEIDSLEYAVRRYRFGLGLNADIVDRAVRHFRGRCADSETFWRTADKCADEGSYFEDTKETVKSILDEVRPELRRAVTQAGSKGSTDSSAPHK
jgi:hypothetical protein